MTVLTDEEVDLALESESEHGWRRQGDKLVRELTFRDFDEAMRFFEQVALAAVDYQRRPDMCISHFNRVHLEIANPHHAGFTVAEVRLAAKVDAVIETHHPTAIQH